MIIGIKSISNQLEQVFLEYGIKDKVELRYSNLNNVDIQCNNLLRISKSTKDLNILKEQIILRLNENELVSRVEILPNNFINISFSNIYSYGLLEKNFYSNIKRNILIDYGEPNIGKDLHVGHIRTLNIGRSLYNLNKIAGNNVVSDIHFGDWECPVALIIAYAENKDITIEELKFNDFEEIYPKASTLKRKYRIL